MFDYRTASEEESLAKAKRLEGRLLGSIPGDIHSSTRRTGRAEVGHAIEAYFGIPQNSSPCPTSRGPASN